MEHSWRLSPYVRFVEKQLMLEPQRLVWAGDYADKEDPKTLTKDEIKPHIDNEGVILKEGLRLYTLSENVGNISEEIESGTKYDYKFKQLAPLKAKYLVNYTKGEYVNKSSIPKGSDGWQIHPLPLLTCEGNLRGGGDYYSERGVAYVGSWSRDLIGVVTKKSEIPKEFKLIEPDFCE